MDKFKDILKRFEMWIMIAVMLWYSDHADIFHSEPMAEQLLGAAQNDCTWIGRFFGLC